MHVFYARLLSTVLFLTLLASCAKKQDILDTIPADTSVVITLCPEQLDHDLNTTAFGGNLTAGQTLEKLFRYATPEVRLSIKTILTTEAIDRKMVVLYSYQDTHGVDIMSMIKNSVYIVTFKVTDGDSLINQLGADSPQSIDGYTAYKLKDSAFLLKGDQGWLISGSRQNAVATVSRHTEVAENASLSESKEVPGFLRKSDRLFNMAISLHDSMFPVGPYYMGSYRMMGKALNSMLHLLIFKAKRLTLTTI